MKPSLRLTLMAGIAGLFWGGLPADAYGQFRVTGLPRDISASGGMVNLRFVVGPAKRVETRNPTVKLRILGSGGTARLNLENTVAQGRRFNARIRGIRRDFTAVIVVKETRLGRFAQRERVRVHVQ